MLSNFGKSITGDSVISLYGFTSTSQTANGDRMIKRRYNVPKRNNIASGEILRPTVSLLTTDDYACYFRHMGGYMLGDDHLSTIKWDNILSELYINNTN
jgi:hypothetical protein